MQVQKQHKNVSSRITLPKHVENGLIFFFFFKFERTVQLTINYTQSSLCLCCYNYQSFYVLGLSCSSLEEYFGFDAQLLVSHRSCLKKPDLISNAAVSYKKQSQPPFFYVSSEGIYETFQSVVLECFTTFFAL